jgi:hypothetical protein
MTNLPKLKIKLPFGDPSEEVCELEQAKYRFFSTSGMMVLVIDGQGLQSYEELVQLAARDMYKDREFIHAELLVELATGG